MFRAHHTVGMCSQYHTIGRRLRLSVDISMVQKLWIRQKTRSTRKQEPENLDRSDQDPENQIDNCYFRMVNLARLLSKNKSKMSFTIAPSAMRRVTQSDFISVPTFTSSTQSLSKKDNCTSEDNSKSEDLSIIVHLQIKISCCCLSRMTWCVI